MVRYGQLLLIRGRDYISRFKPVKRGTCFISVTCARSIFGAWAHRNRHAGTKIAFNSPVWELYSIPLSCNKDGDRRRTLCKKQLASPTHGSPSGRVGRRQVWEKGERWRSGGVEVDKMCSLLNYLGTLCFVWKAIYEILQKSLLPPYSHMNYLSTKC